MLAIAHILVCLLLIRLFSLDRNQAFAVLLFGFFIDLDHIFGIAEYVSMNHGVNLVSIKHAMAADIEWKSLMHQPVAFFVVAPIAVFFVYALPLLSWVLHLLMDYVQIQFLGIISKPEIFLMMTMLAILVSNDYALYSQVNDGLLSVRSFLRWELAHFKGEIRTWLPSLSRRSPTNRAL